MDKNQKLEQLKDRLFESLYYNRIAEARRYCKSIIDKDIYNKSYNFIYDRIECLKKENGRYQELNTLELKLELINAVLNYEITRNSFNLCHEQRFINYCYEALKKCTGEFWQSEKMKTALKRVGLIPKKEGVDTEKLEKVLERLIAEEKGKRIAKGVCFGLGLTIVIILLMVL